MRYIVVLILSLVCVDSFSQNIEDPGEWSDAAIWFGGNVGGVGESVSWDPNTGEVTVTATTGDVEIETMNMSQGNTLTIDVGIDFLINNTGLTGLITGNTTTINVDGDLTINGDLVVNNNLILNVAGSMTVNGSVIINNGGELNIDGSLGVTEDFTAGTGTNIVVDGSVDIGGTLDTDNGSTLTGSGTVTAGDCTGEPDVCTSSTLPIILFEFSLSPSENSVELNWSTSYEENFDYFSIQRSQNGKKFDEIAQLKGQGWSTEINKYSYIDTAPIEGKSYYRLQSFDFDGYTEVFDAVMVEFDGNSPRINIHPNPVNSSTSIDIVIPFNPVKNQFAEIFTIQGNRIKTIDLTTDTFRYNIEGLTEKGMYILKTQSGGKAYTERFLVK